MILYQKREKIFPSHTEIDGNLYLINPDYRNILRIFAILKDKKVPEEKRVGKLVQWFFADDKKTELPYETAIKSFTDFINPQSGKNENTAKRFMPEHSDDDGEKEKRFDYDYDAEEIYSGFMSEYNIDLVEVDFLHWYKFRILLGNLSGESAFRKKIELRFMDLSHFNGKALADASAAKESVQLPPEYSEDELREFAEFDSLWGRV